MLNEFTNQSYLIIENNVVANIVNWDGNTQNWAPPQGSLAIPVAQVSVKIWTANTQTDPWTWELSVVADVQPSVGYTWDGTYCITNDPEPTEIIPNANQPVATGVETI